MFSLRYKILGVFSYLSTEIRRLGPNDDCVADTPFEERIRGRLRGRTATSLGARAPVLRKGEKISGKPPLRFARNLNRFFMNGSKYRFNDHRELFHPAAKTGADRRNHGGGMEAPRSRRRFEGEPASAPALGEPRRHCTAGEIAQELGYSVSYILAVKKAMYPREPRPRRLDPVEVSAWIYAHPAFRMREMYEHHPKDSERGQRLLEI